MVASPLFGWVLGLSFSFDCVGVKPMGGFGCGVLLGSPRVTGFVGWRDHSGFPRAERHDEAGARERIKSLLEDYSNRRRVHSSLGYPTSEEYESGAAKTMDSVAGKETE